jgi:hypothetical protein
MSNFLCNAEKVDMESLPLSLRHFSEFDALHDAKNLVAFLRQTADAEYCADSTTAYPSEAWEGMGLVLNLLQDKIAIASGEYKFPMIDTRS